MNPVAFSVFGQPVYWYGILISIGVLSGIFLAMHNAKIFGVNQDSIVDLALLAIPLAIIGARLYYVIFEWDQYRGNLLDIINIRKGGLAIFGAVLAGILAGFIFSRWRKVDFWNLADICAPSLILGQAIGRWGNFVNQEAFGYAVNNPEWQWFPAAVFIDADQQWHLATFFYESVWNFIVFFTLMSYRRHRKRNGEVFLLYLILYSMGRVVIEGLRTDSLYWGGIRVSQLLSAVLIVFGIAMFVYRRKHTSILDVHAEDVLQENTNGKGAEPESGDADSLAGNHADPDENENIMPENKETEQPKTGTDSDPESNAAEEPRIGIDTDPESNGK
jgi:prolipoprotein diacylglyceryl transferase